MKPIADPHPIAELYVRGALDPEESERFEATWFESDRAYEELQAAEAEALDAYLAGHLSARERAHLESTLLASTQGRRRLADAKALARASTRAGAAPPATARWVPLALAASLLLASFTVLWLARSQHRAQLETARLAARLDEIEGARRHEETTADEARRALSALEQELADARRQLEQRRSAPEPTAAALVLEPTLLRHGGTLPTVSVPAGAGTISLLLTGIAAGNPPFTVRLETVDGEVLWSRSGLEAALVDGRLAIAVTVPCREETAGTHILSLLGRDGTPPQVLAQFALRILRAP